MLKNAFVNIFGANAYMNTFHYVAELYHSTFLALKEPGLDLLPNLISRGGTVVDIGASIGRFTRMAAGHVGPAGSVHAFEPLSFPVRILRHMVRLRGLSQVTVVNMALGDHCGAATMCIPLSDGWKPKPGLAHLGPAGADAVMTETVRTTTLDDYCMSTGLTRLDFIKCDAEGYEHFIFQGGLRTIRRFSPVVYCEIEKPYCRRNGVEADKIFEFFRVLNYKSFYPGKDGLLVPIVRYQDNGNYFFILETHPALKSIVSGAVPS
jgi:FkbM family methyltransferase